MTANVPMPDAAEVEAQLTWQADADGRLDGALEVRNVGTRTVRVGGKPVVEPLDRDGHPLETGFAVTAELRMPSYVDLHPGRRAAAPVSWGAWNGEPPSRRARVHIGDLTLDVDVRGPVRPANSAGPTNLSSSWFDLLPE